MCLVDLYIFINKNENINLFIGSVFGTSVIISETKLYSEKKVVVNIASVIVTSTIMSFVTLPIVVFYSLKYFQ